MRDRIRAALDAAHRFTGTPAPLEENATIFAFADHDLLHGPRRTS